MRVARRVYDTGVTTERNETTPMVANDAVADNIAFTLVFRPIAKIRNVSGGDEEFTTAHSIRVNAMAYSGRAVGTALVEYVTFRGRNSPSPLTPIVGWRPVAQLDIYFKPCPVIVESFIGMAENLFRTPWNVTRQY